MTLRLSYTTRLYFCVVSFKLIIWFLICKLWTSNQRKRLSHLFWKSQSDVPCLFRVSWHGSVSGIVFVGPPSFSCFRTHSAGSGPEHKPDWDGLNPGCFPCRVYPGCCWKCPGFWSSEPDWRAACAHVCWGGNCRTKFTSWCGTKREEPVSGSEPRSESAEFYIQSSQTNRASLHSITGLMVQHPNPPNLQSAPTESMDLTSFE